MRDSTNKSIIKLNTTEIKLTRVICFRMGKTYIAKTSPGDFKVTIPENSLLSQQAVTSKGISVPYTNFSWTLTPIPNWICFVVTISHFQCMVPSTWLTNRCADPSTWLNYQLEKDVGWLQSSSIHHTMKIKKFLSHKTLRCINTVVSSRER